MSSRKDFLDKLVRKPVQMAMNPKVRDLAVNKDGDFIDLMSNQRLGDPLELDAEHVQKKLVLVNFFTIRGEEQTQYMTKIAALTKQFGEHMGRDVFINSVTLDPENDTPKRLTAFAKQIGAPEGWTFVRAMGDAHKHIGSKMNRVRGYSSALEVFYGTPGGFWGTFPVDNSPEATAQRLLDSIPGPKPETMRRAGPARRDQEKFAWSARAV